jgi:hypothetical protein
MLGFRLTQSKNLLALIFSQQVQMSLTADQQRVTPKLLAGKIFRNWRGGTKPASTLFTSRVRTGHLSGVASLM